MKKYLKEKMIISMPLVLVLCLLSVVVVSGGVLSSSFVSADGVVDEISITVPVSCTMSGTGQDSHDSEIVNGLYDDDIGSTTVDIYCNDFSGFAVYAAGYTGDKIGETNSNKLIGTNTSAVIETGLATSAGNPDVSNWAMKLTKTGDSGDITGTNAFTIDSAPNTSGGAAAPFASYHAIPNEYTKVAHKDSATDMTESTGGAKFTTTYAAYISQDQPADTYSGQVIYTLVHPSIAPEPLTNKQIAINFHDNDLGFPSSDPVNRVTYERVATTNTWITIDDGYEVSKTANMNEDGTYNGAELTNDGYAASGGETILVENADMLKIVIKYNGPNRVCWDDGENNVYCYTSDVDVENPNNSTLGPYSFESHGYEETEEVYIAGDEARFEYYYMNYYYDPSDLNMIPTYYYARVYPVHYANENDPGAIGYDTTYSFVAMKGQYAETNTWNGKWYGDVPVLYENCDYDEYDNYSCTTETRTERRYFEDENEIKEYLDTNYSILLGETIDFYSYHPYRIFYDGNNATAGTMNGYYTELETLDESTALAAPNFKKTGYGLAGWSENSNATINSNDTIYGPIETVAGSSLTFDNNRTTTLYAVWVAPSGNMQSFSCNSLSGGDVAALTDTRDNNVYTVGKLVDGKCWMMENLRLADKDDNNNDVILSSQNTNNPSLPITNVYNATSPTTSNHLSSAANPTQAAWCTTSGTACDNQSMLSTNNTTLFDTSSYSPTGNVYSYGNYYNWYSATAGHGKYGPNYSQDYYAGGDICPTGWHLPKGGNKSQESVNEFWQLIVTGINNGTNPADYNSNGLPGYAGVSESSAVFNALHAYPNNFVCSGGTRGSLFDGRNSSGNYWSASGYSDGAAYSLRLASDGIHPGTASNYKHLGRTVRCVTGN